MSRLTVDIQELAGRFAELAEVVAAGDEVIITERAIPRARLVALVPSQPRTAGLHRGAMKASRDFDDPLPREFWDRGV